jgi:hypothetical protein
MEQATTVKNARYICVLHPVSKLPHGGRLLSEQRGSETGEEETFRKYISSKII